MDALDGLPFALAVLAAGLFVRGPGMLAALMLCTLFGATAAIALPGGAPITPAVLLLPFLCWRALAERGVAAHLQALQFPGAGFWLAMLVLWGALSAIFLPHVFGGATLVRGTDRATMAGVQLLPLQPLSTNLTQTGYALGSLAAFAAVRALLEEGRQLGRFADAVLWLAFADCLAALLNLAELYLGVPSVLEYVRNAGYAILVGGEIGGLLRISGTFAETSTFSAFSLPLFAFCASLWAAGVRPRASGALAAFLLLLLLGSTSSTAYAGLAAYAACLGGAALLRALCGARGARIGPITLLLWAAAVAACIVLLLRPEIGERIVDYFQLTLVRKLDSASALERGSWNTQAWQNFVDTYGIGTGLGSARASSYPLVLASNLGVPGLLLFIAFLWRVFGVGDAAPADALSVASRRAVLAALIAASISGVVFDLGLAFYAYAAAATAGEALRRTSIGASHALA
jgi:hypothetical protein